MAQAVRRSAWPSGEVEQAEQQARVWAEGLVELHQRIGGRFGRVEPRRRALAYLRGLLSQVERNNSWWLAEQAGEVTPDGMQRLLNGSGGTPTGSATTCATMSWSSWVIPMRCWCWRRRAWCRQGDRSAGVPRQDTGTVGKQENCQVAVFLAYAAPGGVALVDRDLYLPKSWTDDRARCRATGIPDEVGFQTKPQLGQVMLERALAAGVPSGWVPGDTVYGGDRRLRVWLEEHATRHVMAVKCTEPVWALTDRGPGQVAAQDPGRRGRARAVAAAERRGWQQGQAVLGLDQGAAVALGLAGQRGLLAAGPPQP
jgi:hypothetical protein